MIKAGFEQKQELQLKLSQAMIQKLEILALPTLELREKASTMLLENPALRELPKENNSDFYDHIDKPLNYKSNFYANTEYEINDNKKSFIENTLTIKETLQDHLNKQVFLLDINEERKNSLLTLISSLDEKGFITKESNAYLDALDLLQKLDPIGLGAKDPIESLLIQAKIEAKIRAADIKLLKELLKVESLELLKIADYKTLSQRLGVDEDSIIFLFDYIKTLNPYPGYQYPSSQVQYINIDAYIINKNGKLEVSLNSANLPSLTLDPNFIELSKDKRLSDKDKEYFDENLTKAKNMIDSINLFEKALDNILNLLISLQRDFFLHGFLYLKPLTQSKVAKILNVSDSTISRIVTNKYIKTSFGIFSIQKLFSNEVNGSSSTVLKNELKNIIDKTPSLSDQEVADILSEKGFKIARRTVNKYRKEILGAISDQELKKIILNLDTNDEKAISLHLKESGYVVSKSVIKKVLKELFAL